MKFSRVLCDAYDCVNQVVATSEMDVYRAIVREGWLATVDGRLLCPDHAWSSLQRAS